MSVSGILSNPKSVISFGLFLLFALVTYWVAPFGESNFLWESAVYLAAPLLAVGSAGYLFFKYGLTGNKSLMFFCMLVGLFFLFLGEALYVYFDIYLEESPFPTVADAFYLLSYPFIFMSIYIGARFMHANLRSKSLRPGLLFLAVFLTLIAVEVYWGIFSAYVPDETILNKAITLAYGIGDLFIIAGALGLYLLARNTLRTDESFFWTGIAAGFASITVADLLFIRFYEVYVAGNYFAKNSMDSLWILGYSTIAFFLLNLVPKIAGKGSGKWY